MINSLLEQEKKNRLKNGTLVIGRANFQGQNPEVSVSVHFSHHSLLATGLTICDWRRIANFDVIGCNACIRFVDSFLM